MVVLKNIKNIFLIPELRRKLLVSLAILIITRLGTFIPVIGVNVYALGEYIANAARFSGVLSYIDVFSGGALGKATLFALGIGPYITSSIMMQILGMTVPALEAKMKEGEYGRKEVNQYTRYLTVFLSVIYSIGYATFLETQGLVFNPGWAFRILFVLSLTTGALFVMWLGEQISIHGIGNGSSLIIAAGSIAHFPGYVRNTWRAIAGGSLEPWQALLILAIFIFIAGLIVYLEKGERKIPVQYARRVVGQRVYGGQSTYIPFKINTVGVMPVIFAQAFLSAPLFLTSLLSARFPILRAFGEMWSPTSVIFNVALFVLIVVFSFVYSALLFNPDDLADKIKKGGGYILNIRPGQKTAEYFNYILTRIGLIGAVYLALLALSPNIMMALFNMPFYLGGTSLLIVVSVCLELASQIESYLLEHRYEGFLTTGRLKSRTARI